MRGRGGVCARGACMAGECAWLGACMAGSVHGRKNRQLQRAVRIVLECILVLEMFVIIKKPSPALENISGGRGLRLFKSLYRSYKIVPFFVGCE